jgi:hypothetical protein
VVLAMLTAIYSVIKFVTKSIMRELLPNSGESMRDSIEDTKIELRILSARVDSIYEILAVNSPLGVLVIADCQPLMSY